MKKVLLGNMRKTEESPGMCRDGQESFELVRNCYNYVGICRMDRYSEESPGLRRSLQESSGIPTNRLR